MSDRTFRQFLKILAKTLVREGRKILKSCIGRALEEVIVICIVGKLGSWALGVAFGEIPAKVMQVAACVFAVLRALYWIWRCEEK
ncbi:MAG: hypothetical protein DRJ38_00275 [Thermoprotei archaeon]|nr:MAG: hypothetical protein DRJ38_00275 [Thermoprotei archaeon]